MSIREDILNRYKTEPKKKVIPRLTPTPGPISLVDPGGTETTTPQTHTPQGIQGRGPVQIATDVIDTGLSKFGNLLNPKEIPAEQNVNLEGVDLNKPRIRKAYNESQQALENLRNVQLEPIRASDLPTVPRGAVDIGTGVLGVAEGLSGALEWGTGLDTAPLSEKIQTWREDMAAEDPTFLDELAAGVGSASVFFIPGVGIARLAGLAGAISPIAASYVGSTLSAFLESSVEAGLVYNQVKETDGVVAANKAAFKTFVANMILVGVTNKLGIFGDNKGLLKRVLFSAPIEGLQEFWQEVISNANTGEPWFDNALKSGALGTIIGGGFAATTPQGPTGVLPTLEDLNDKLNELADEGKISAGLSIQDVSGDEFKSLTEEAKKFDNVEDFEKFLTDFKGTYVAQDFSIPRNLSVEQLNITNPQKPGTSKILEEIGVDELLKGEKILVDKNLNIIDGNNRLAFFKSKGVKRVDVLQTFDKEEIGNLTEFFNQVKGIKDQPKKETLAQQSQKSDTAEEFVDFFAVEPTPDQIKDKDFDLKGFKPFDEPHAIAKVSDLTPSEQEEFLDVINISEKTKKKVDEITQFLKDNPTQDVTPVYVKGLITDTKLAPQVLDGHHRMAAYIQAGREDIPIVYDRETLTEFFNQAKDDTLPFKTLFRGVESKDTQTFRESSDDAKLGKGIYFGTDRQTAKLFGDNIEEVNISPDARIFQIPQDITNGRVRKELVQQKRSEGFDGAIGRKEVIIFNKNVIKPKETSSIDKLPTQQTTEGRKTKQVIKQLTQPTTKKVTKTEKQLLNEKIKQQAKGAKVGAREATKQTKKSVSNELVSKFNAILEDVKRQQQLGKLKENIIQRSVTGIKQDIVDFANTFLKLEDRGKLLTAVKNIKTVKQLEAAKDRISEIGETSQTKALRAKIKKELSNIKPPKQAGKPVGKFTPFIQKVLDGMKEAIKLTEEQADVVIEKNLQDPIITPAVALHNKILSTFSGLQEKDSAQLQKMLDHIQKIKTEGRALNELNKFNIEEDLARKKNLVVDGATGGKGLPQGLQTTGKVEKTFTQKGKATLKSLGAKWVMSWNGLMGIVDFNAGIDNQKLSKTFSVLNQENEYKLRQHRYVDRLSDAISSAYNIENKPSKIRKVIIDKNQPVQLGKFTNSIGQEVELNFTVAEMMKMYAEFQDPTLTESFEKGNNFTEEIKTAIEKTLSTQDKTFVNKALDMWQGQYDEMNPVFSKINGIDLPSNPNYSPIKRVGFEVNTEKGLGEFIAEATYRKAISTSAIKSRVKNVLPIQKQNIFEVLDHHFTETNYYITWVEKIRELDSVFKDQRVRFAIEDNYTRKVVSAIDNTINDISTHGNKISRRYKAVDWFRKKFTVGALMIKPSLTAKQYVSTIAYYEVLSPTELASGVVDFWKNPIKNAKILNEESILIKERGSNMERDIKDAMKSDIFHRYSKVQNFINTLMLNVRLGDKGAILTGSWAIRKARLAKGDELNNIIAEYEKFSSETQQSADLSQLSEVQRGGSFEQLFTMFKSSQRQYLAKEVNVIKSLFQEGGTSPANIKKVAKTMAIYHLMLPMFFQFVSNFGGWDEDDKKEYIRAGLLGSLNGLFLFGDIADSVIRSAIGLRVWDNELPVVTIADDINRALREIDLDDISIEDMGAALLQLSKAGNALGIPVEQVLNTGQGVASLMDGDIKEGVGMMLGWSPYAVGATKSKKKPSTRAEILRKYKTSPSDIRRQILNKYQL